MPDFHGTTILGVLRDGKAALGGDGQLTVGDTIVKHSTQKVRKLCDDSILAGFAGSAADALTLLARFEEKLNKLSGNLLRASIELARDWRTDKYLRRLEAMLAVMNKSRALIISGNGDVIEPEDGIIGIGSGSGYATAAARAIALTAPDAPPEEMVKMSLEIAADICIYTNRNITVLTLGQ